MDRENASTELKLASPTISVQIRRLEEQLGEKLLRRSGRHVVPTEMGQVVYRYADDIFALGRELVDTARGRPTGRPMHVVIGVHDVVPKSIARRLIEPALKLPDPVRITCREGSSEQLLADLSVQRVDVVLGDAPISPTVKVRAYNHLLGETGLSLLGVPRLVRKYRPGFPRSLHDAPMLMPTPGTTVRRNLDQWFDALDIRPRVVGEFDDSELRWEFGATGIGVFSAPLVLETHLAQLYNAQRIGWGAKRTLDFLRDLGGEEAQASGRGRNLRGGTAYAVRQERAGRVSAGARTASAGLIRSRGGAPYGRARRNAVSERLEHDAEISCEVTSRSPTRDRGSFAG